MTHEIDQIAARLDGIQQQLDELAQLAEDNNDFVASLDDDVRAVYWIYVEQRLEPQLRSVFECALRWRDLYRSDPARPYDAALENLYQACERYALLAAPRPLENNDG